MSSLFGGGPKFTPTPPPPVPPAPPPPPDPPRAGDTAAQEAAGKARIAARTRRGRQSTILAGDTAGDAGGGYKTKLGE